MPADSKKKRWIRPLPERLINKIAAGEVVERPAAVVKELIENALDASATQIDISIEKSGLKLMKIVDNGCGIDEDQIEIAFSRHATSKISDYTDLDRLTSFGFRGEALPSIASVSRARMVSKPASSQTATEVIIEGGVLQSKQQLSGPVGSSIEIENLFFNTPARRKFLKAESTEARQISRIVTAMAIGAPAVGFSYSKNGREMFSLPPDQGLTERITSLLAPGKKLADLDYQSESMKISGAMGMPDNLLSNRYGQYLFLNGRYIQSPSLSHALSAGYGELIPRGRFPIGAVRIEIDPEEVDVNVHPAKTEVRLAHERDIYRAIFHAVSAAVQKDHTIPTFQTGGSPRPAGSPGVDPNPPNQQISGRNSNVIPGMSKRAYTPSHFMSDLYRTTPIPDTKDQPERIDRTTGEILSQAPSAALCLGADRLHEADHLREADQVVDNGDLLTGLRFVGHFSKLYLLFQRGQDLLIVDQHTAHERILYERTLQEIQRHSALAQQMLLPEQVELSLERYALYEEVSDLLNKSGFIIAPFGGRMVNIEGVPSVLSGRSPEKTLMQMLDDLASFRKGGQDLVKGMAQSIACRAAVMSGDKLSAQEAVSLIEQLMACENSYSCPHGRPTFVKLTREDINRQFGRG